MLSSHASKLAKIALLLQFVACDKASSDASNTPDAGASTAGAESESSKPDAEPDTAVAGSDAADSDAAAAEPAKDHFTIGTFNLAWAHDTFGEYDPKRSVENRAQTDADWEWKLGAIAGILAEAKLDVVALHELGGDLETTQIVEAIAAAGGPEYEYAYQDSDDPQNGHNSAILSRFPLSNERRLDIHLRRHVVADVELPSGGPVTIIAVHTPEGSREKPEKARRDQVESLERELGPLRQKHPVIVLGTFGSNVVPADDGYAESAAGMLAGADTRDEADDCQDSADVGRVLQTTSDETLADRIFTCGIEMRDAETRFDDKIVRDGADDWKRPWSQVPVDAEPFRDVSDHLLLVAIVELPKPKADADADADADE